MKNIPVLLFCLLNALSLSAQTKVLDSFRHYIYHRSANSAGQKEHLFAALLQQRSMNLDTLGVYISLTGQYTLSPAEKLYADIARVYYYTRIGRFDSSGRLVARNLQRMGGKPPKPELLTFYQFLDAGLALRSGDQKRSLDIYYKALRRSEQYHDTAFQMRSFNGIGWVYMEMFQYAEAIRWFRKALEAGAGSPAIRKANAATIYTNMASCYGALEHMDSAKHYAVQALSYALAAEDRSAEANAIVVNANIALFENRMQASVALMERAVAMRRLLNDPFYILSDLCVLSNIYASMNKTAQGLAAANEALAIARRYGLYTKLPMIYISFEGNYSQAGDYKRLSETYAEHMQVKDSLYRKKLAEELATQEARYGSEKKEREIARQRLVIQHEQDSRRVLLFGGGAILLLAGAGLAIYLQRNRARQEKELFRSILEGEQKERIRIARDLHDSIGQMLSVVRMNVSAMPQTDGHAAAKPVQHTLSLIDNTLQEVRHISHNLIPEELNFGLQAALEELCDKVNAAGATTMTLQIDDTLDIQHFTRQFELSLYRVVQEVTGNILKHAQANTVSIMLKSEQDALQLRIADDGKGFDTSLIRNSKSLGWRNIQARINLLDGRMNIQSERTKGTTIDIWIPRKNRQQEAPVSSSPTTTSW